MLRMFGAAAAVSCLLSGAPVLACGSGQLLLEDQFNSLQAMWGPADKYMSAKGGQLVIAEDDGHYYTALAGPIFHDIDYCATVRLVKASDKEASYGGITFWAKDYDNFYTFQITPDGYATAYKYADGDWTALVKDRETKSIRQGSGAANELRAVIVGGNATLFINGTRFDVISGTMPDDGHRIGFTIEAPENGSAAFALDNLKVNTPVADK